MESFDAPLRIFEITTGVFWVIGLFICVMLRFDRTPPKDNDTKDKLVKAVQLLEKALKALKRACFSLIITMILVGTADFTLMKTGGKLTLMLLTAMLLSILAYCVIHSIKANILRRIG